MKYLEHHLRIQRIPQGFTYSVRVPEGFFWHSKTVYPNKALALDGAIEFIEANEYIRHQTTKELPKRRA